jgi:hypothetical protein
MQVVGQSNVHRVDVRASQKTIVSAIADDLANTIEILEPRSLVRIARHERSNPRVCGLSDPWQEALLRNPTRADNCVLDDHFHSQYRVGSHERLIEFSPQPRSLFQSYNRGRGPYFKAATPFPATASATCSAMAEAT